MEGKADDEAVEAREDAQAHLERSLRKGGGAVLLTRTACVRIRYLIIASSSVTVVIAPVAPSPSGDRCSGRANQTGGEDWAQRPADRLPRARQRSDTRAIEVLALCVKFNLSNWEAIDRGFSGAALFLILRPSTHRARIRSASHAPSSG